MIRESSSLENISSRKIQVYSPRVRGNQYGVIIARCHGQRPVDSVCCKVGKGRRYAGARRVTSPGQCQAHANPELRLAASVESQWRVSAYSRSFPLHAAGRAWKRLYWLRRIQRTAVWYWHCVLLENCSGLPVARTCKNARLAAVSEDETAELSDLLSQSDSASTLEPNHWPNR